MMIPPGATVLFQGDSITDAFRKPEEINHAYQLGNGYAFLIASELLFKRPNDDLRFENRGVSGNGARDLTARWQQDCLDLRPDVVSILIGVNETIRTFNHSDARTPREFGEDNRALLERTRKALPDARCVLCEPFLLPCGLAQPEWSLDMAQRQAIVREIATETKSVFVPLQKMFEDMARLAAPQYWAYDGIHPTAPGHYLIARQWLQCVAAI